MKTSEIVEGLRTTEAEQFVGIAADQLALLEAALQEVQARCQISLGLLNLVHFDSYGNSEWETLPNLVAWLKERGRQ